MTGATYPNGQPVPAWAGSVSRLHGIGLLSVEKYRHRLRAAAGGWWWRRGESVPLFITEEA